MTYPDGPDADDYDEPDDYYDDEPWREPDPEDHEIAKAYEEHYEHCERVHGGGECDCRPSRLTQAWQGTVRRASGLRRQAQAFVGQMHTVRIGPLELTARFRPPHRCGACGGRGWFYTKGAAPEPMPEGYNGAALCGCGSAITRLTESRRYIRKMRKEPPF